MKQYNINFVNKNMIEVYVKKPFYQDITSFRHEIDDYIRKNIPAREGYVASRSNAFGKYVIVTFVLRNFEEDIKPFIKNGGIKCV